MTPPAPAGCWFRPQAAPAQPGRPAAVLRLPVPSKTPPTFRPGEELFLFAYTVMTLPALVMVSTMSYMLPLQEQEQLTIYTFAVRPDCRGGGVGRALLGYAEAWAKAQGKRALRLDVHEINTPAIKLYESCGFRYIATVDLGYGAYGLKWFRLYEKLL